MAQPANYTLMIEDEQGRRSSVSVELGDITIGRDEDNTVRLQERNISRHHARLRSVDGGVMVEDLDSYNGVFLNGERVQGSHPIREKDILRVGDFQLSLTRADDGALDNLTETTQVNAKIKSFELLSTAPSAPVTSTQIAPSPMGSHPDEEESTAVSAPPKARVNPVPEREEATAIIRLSQRADLEALQDKSAKALTGDKPRLICVSTHLAGTIYEITKSEMVMGRTEDNDLRIDHRSVSRHHSKIGVDGRRCKVTDLGGVNGTLVNGEPYAELALKAGDLIELGHVKLRFVPAGEQYTLTPEEQQAVNSAQKSSNATGAGFAADDDEHEDTAVDGKRVKRRWGMIAGGIAALVVILGGVSVWLTGNRHGNGLDGDGQATLNLVPAGTDAAANTALGQGEAPGGDAGAGEDDAQKRDTEQLIVRARAALAQKHWSEAGAFAGAVLMREPAHTEALAIRQQTEEEQRYQASFDFASAAMARQSWQEASDALESIPSSSSYGPDAARLKSEMTATRVQLLLNAAKDEIQRNGFDEAKLKLDEVDGLVANHPEVGVLRQKIAQTESRLQALEDRESGAVAEAQAAQNARDAKDAQQAKRAAQQAKAEQKAEAKAKAAAEAKIKAEAKAKAAAEAKMRADAEAKMRADAEAKAKAEASSKVADAPPPPPVGSSSAAAPKETASGGVGAKSYFTEGIKALTGGQVADAIDRFNRCVQVDSRFALCYRALGIAYARKGDAPKAARNYRLYLKADPNASDAAQVRQLLQEYDKAP